MHLNSGQFDVSFGLAVRLDANGSVQNLAVEEGQTEFPNYAGKGVCLARAHLFGTLDPVAGNPIVLKANKESVIRTWPSDYHAQRRLAYAVLELDVVCPAGTTVSFRTFATSSGSVGVWNDDPPAPHPTHPHVRGWWPKSGIVVQVPLDEFDARPDGGSDVRHAGICDIGGCVEHSPGAGFGALTGAGHEFDLGNKGCYGADLEYRLQLVNTSETTPGSVFANIVARHVETYFGAAHVAVPGGIEADKRHVPQLFEPNYPFTREAVDMLQARPGRKFVVAARTFEEDSLFLRVRVADGGACATPANVVVSREPISGQPLEGGS